MKHAELIARLEAAEVGSRELDAEVWAASVGYELVSFDGAGWLYKTHPNDIQRHERTGYINPYTTSLDAARALHERVLPEAGGVLSFGGQYSSVQMHVPGLPRGRAKAPELAWCIAILRALDSQSDTA